MKQILGIVLIGINLISMAPAANWQRYEAENAALSGGPTVASDGTASGGQYVNMNSAGSIDFTVSVPATDTYLMRVANKGTTSTSRCFEGILVNGVQQVNQQYAAGYFWDPAVTGHYTATGELDVFLAFKAHLVTYGNTGDPWQVSERWWEHQHNDTAHRNTPMTILLNAGTNTIRINKNWGGTKWDYIEIDVDYPAAPLAVSYTVNTEQDRAAISPYIYGSSLRFDVIDDSLTQMRFGGNHTTPYNWENNCNNAGSDWYHHSGRIGSSTVPGAAIVDFVDKAQARGQESLITLPMAGYVAADANGEVTEAETAPSSRWKQTVYRKGSAFCSPPGNPNVSDGVVYSDEFINFLVSQYGNASTPTGVKFYALCNEPVLWDYTHARIHPLNLTGGELIDRSTQLASAVKDVDPYATIYGPVFYGIWPMMDLQNGTDWNTIKNGYFWFVDYYLDQMKQASDTYGARLVDVFDFHWYSHTDSTNTTPEYIQGRMQAPRRLWDPDHDGGDTISQYFSQYVPVLPLVQDSIDTYNPGTRIAITEYAFGGDNHISGGIATADVLGIYGKYGLFGANYWTLKTTTYYPNAAFRLYRNYDGSRSTYGDMKVAASMSDKVNSSLYASTFSDNPEQVHMIVLNKNLTNDITGSFTINSSRQYTHGRVWAFDEASPDITERTPITSITGNTFTYTIPPLTACHMVLLTDDAPPMAPTNLTGQVFSGQAVFNWDASVEPDVTGYHVYRSETSGSGYTRIASDVPVNSFLDAALTKGITYYYVVSAVDADSLEGPTGNEVSALWVDQPTLPKIYEAENALIHGASLSTEHGGYSGSGYVDYNGTGNYIEWTVAMGIGERYSLQFRYANGSTNRPLEIQVNGQVVAASLAFDNTGGWSTWGLTDAIYAQLKTGLNTIRATAVDSSGSNVDYLRVAGAFTNTAPTWNTTPVNESDAAEGFDYSAALADDATDVNGNPLLFAKVSGPAWLTVAPNGMLYGTPGQAAAGLGSWTVSVSDGIAAPVQATLNITTFAAGDLDQSGCVNLIDFSQFASQWQETIDCYGLGCPDLSRNSIVDMADLVWIASNWLYGNCP